MKGTIISIEGTDGSGKHTQQQLLLNDLREMGLSVFDQSFPNYESNSSAPVKMYLGGEFGSDPNCLDPYQASTLYAVDRLCTYNLAIKPHYEAGDIVLFDRYVQSNLIHQSSRFSSEAERQKFIKFMCNFEFEKLQLPKPDLIFFIEMPVEKSLELARAREAYKSGKQKDILEENTEYMKKSYDTGLALAKQMGWTIIHCVDESGEIKSIDEIHSEIMKITREFLKA